jgi:hypothetical protein
MNVFQSTYEHRLRDWKQLRSKIKTLSIEQQCIEIDKWWQAAPFVKHHLSWSDSNNWSDPWTLLSENTYCSLTKAVGMCYTLLLTEVDSIELVVAKDSLCEEHYLVLVDKSKYILNYHPNTVISNVLTSFEIISSKSLESIKSKIK